MLPIISGHSAIASTCYGLEDCNACTTCNYCKNCNNGGHKCGVWHASRMIPDDSYYAIMVPSRRVIHRPSKQSRTMVAAKPPKPEVAMPPLAPTNRTVEEAPKFAPSRFRVARK